MCKATPLQHNGIEITPESTLRFKEGGLLKFKDRYVMQHLARDLGYPFYLHDGQVYTSELEGTLVAREDDVFKVATPMGKGRAAQLAKSIPIAVLA